MEFLGGVLVTVFLYFVYTKVVEAKARREERKVGTGSGGSPKFPNRDQEQK